MYGVYFLMDFQDIMRCCVCRTDFSSLIFGSCNFNLTFFPSCVVCIGDSVMIGDVVMIQSLVYDPMRSTVLQAPSSLREELNSRSSDLEILSAKLQKPLHLYKETWNWISLLWEVTSSKWRRSPAFLPWMITSAIGRRHLANGSFHYGNNDILEEF